MIRPRIVVRVLLGAVALAIAGAPLFWVAPPAGAQQTPPAAVGIGDDVVATAKKSLGLITVLKKSSIAWVAAPGVVVTSDEVANEVGKSATFTRLGSEAALSCYVGVHVAEQRLSVLRCAQLDAPALKIESRYPAPGTPVFVAGLTNGNAIQVEGGTVTANDTSFMGTKRLQLSFHVDAPSQYNPIDGILEYESLPGSPVIDATGRVVSVGLVSPNQGGQPLGLTASELTNAVEEALPLPESFTSAAIIVGGKRAIIPVAIGLVLGLAWGLISRNHTVITKTLGMGVVGVLGVIAYSAMSLVVAGPQALI